MKFKVNEEVFSRSLYKKQYMSKIIGVKFADKKTVIIDNKISIICSVFIPKIEMRSLQNCVTQDNNVDRALGTKASAPKTFNLSLIYSKEHLPQPHNKNTALSLAGRVLERKILTSKR